MNRTAAIAVGLATAIVWGGSAAAEDPPLMPGTNWHVQDKSSALDNSHEYIAYVEAAQPVADLLGRDKKPLLSLSCTHNGLFFSIMWPDFIEKDYDDTNVEIVWRLGRRRRAALLLGSRRSVRLPGWQDRSVVGAEVVGREGANRPSARQARRAGGHIPSARDRPSPVGRQRDELRLARPTIGLSQPSS